MFGDVDAMRREVARREEQVNHYLKRLDMLNRDLSRARRDGAFMLLWAIGASVVAFGLVIWRLL